MSFSVINSRNRSLKVNFSRMASNIQVTKKCLHCGNEFVAKTLVTRYCTKVCNNRHYKFLRREEKLQEYEETQADPQKDKVGFDLTIQQKEFLSIDETAQLIGASKRTIQRLIASDRLAVGKIGSRTIITRKAINTLFNL